MNNLLLLGVDLVPATISECAVGGSDLFLRRSMHRIGPFWTVGIHKVSAHVTVALVHEEARARATISECAVGGSDLFLRRSMHRIGPFWTVGIHKVSAHVTVALVHEEA